MTDQAPELLPTRERIARVLYECEKRRGTHSDSVVKSAFPRASDALLMEPWEECKDTFLSDADAVLAVLPHQPDATVACYLERSKVREILTGQPDEALEITEVILAEIDALPIFSVRDLLTRPTPAERPVPQVREALEKCRPLVESFRYQGKKYSELLDEIDCALTARPSDAAVAGTIPWKDDKRQFPLYELAPDLTLYDRDPQADERLKLYRDIFAEITTKAVPICDPTNNDPERVRHYHIPAGPLHRAAGKLGFQLFNGEQHLANAVAEIARLKALASPHEEAVRETLKQIRRYCDENLGPSRSSLLNKIAKLADDALSPTVASERVSGRETMTNVPADRVIGELAAEQVWRPIETAPRDGTALLLTDARIKNWTQVAYWDTDYERWARDDTTTLWHANRFTHWTPLPQPPEDSLVLKNEEQSEPVSSPHPTSEQAGSKVR